MSQSANKASKAKQNPSSEPPQLTPESKYKKKITELRKVIGDGYSDAEIVSFLEECKGDTSLVINRIFDGTFAPQQWSTVGSKPTKSAKKQTPESTATYNGPPQQTFVPQNKNYNSRQDSINQQRRPPNNRKPQVEIKKAPEPDPRTAAPRAQPPKSIPTPQTHNSWEKPLQQRMQALSASEEATSSSTANREVDDSHPTESSHQPHTRETNGSSVNPQTTHDGASVSSESEKAESESSKVQSAHETRSPTLEKNNNINSPSTQLHHQVKSVPQNSQPQPYTQHAPPRQSQAKSKSQTKNTSSRQSSNSSSQAQAQGYGHGHGAPVEGPVQLPQGLDFESVGGGPSSNFQFGSFADDSSTPDFFDENATEYSVPSDKTHSQNGQQQQYPVRVQQHHNLPHSPEESLHGQMANMHVSSYYPYEEHQPRPAFVPFDNWGSRYQVSPTAHKYYDPSTYGYPPTYSPPEQHKYVTQSGTYVDGSNAQGDLDNAQRLAYAQAYGYHQGFSFSHPQYMPYYKGDPQTSYYGADENNSIEMDSEGVLHQIPQQQQQQPQGKNVGSSSPYRSHQQQQGQYSVYSQERGSGISQGNEAGQSNLVPFYSEVPTTQFVHKYPPSYIPQQRYQQQPQQRPVQRNQFQSTNQ
eukprot:TRINITY_DN4878_c0_g1_i1.p1 TRINITY_DN4878_c0_g1~~TRINITY_DN4878_c0_g1_i1.p1  ORF type:complete len:639 (-),score=118.55 TRINITY_DN4878_c0_g1_i1:249-2165(-)